MLKAKKGLKAFPPNLVNLSSGFYICLSMNTFSPKQHRSQRRRYSFLRTDELPNTIIHINATAAGISRCPAAQPLR